AIYEFGHKLIRISKPYLVERQTEKQGEREKTLKPDASEKAAAVALCTDLRKFALTDACLKLWLELRGNNRAELGSGLEFPGAEGQWTRFPKWNACCESEMSFQLKTRSARGLFRNTTLFIDQVEAKWVEVKSKRRDMTVFSGLFVGGLPPELRAAALKLTLASVREREPFKGGEVKLDDEPPNSGGGSPCEAGEEGEGGVCLNGGVCSVVDDQAVCDCSRTGFRGKDCSQAHKFLSNLFLEEDCRDFIDMRKAHLPKGCMDEREREKTGKALSTIV
ncbi:hypothetical protein E2I00_017366, partial [Balaenoptera physalus]